MAKRKRPDPFRNDPPDKPGFGVFTRHMPDATQEEKEEAYQNVRNLIRALLTVGERLEREVQERELNQTVA